MYNNVLKIPIYSVKICSWRLCPNVLQCTICTSWRYYVRYFHRYISTMFCSFPGCTHSHKSECLTLPYLWAYEPVSNEWNIIIVSSRSQMKIRSKSLSGPGDGLFCRLPRLLPRAEIFINEKYISKDSCVANCLHFIYLCISSRSRQ